MKYPENQLEIYAAYNVVYATNGHTAMFGLQGDSG
jgi:hypothetical protein